MIWKKVTNLLRLLKGILFNRNCTILIKCKLNFGEYGLIDGTEIYMYKPFWTSIKEIGFKRLHKIRSMSAARVLKQKYTLEAYEDLKRLDTIDLDAELNKMMRMELNELNENN